MRRQVFRRHPTLTLLHLPGGSRRKKSRRSLLANVCDEPEQVRILVSCLGSVPTPRSVGVGFGLYFLSDVSGKRKMEFWMFLGTLAVGGVWLAFAPFLLPAADRSSLRAGLWMNGIEGPEADRIIEWNEQRGME